MGPKSSHATEVPTWNRVAVSTLGAMTSTTIAGDTTPAGEPDDVRWLDVEEQRTWRAFIAATRLLFDQLDRELQHGAHMPHGYYEILVRLSETPTHSMRMSDLASSSLSSRSRLSHAIARLEGEGWVRREQCPTDKRGQLAVLTDAGFAALQAAAPGHVEGVRRHLFDQLRPEQVQQLREISSAIASGLVETDPANAGFLVALDPFRDTSAEGAC
jgi:DNA-binding MarR family transcriptional regulator